jgi:hypothetical protein
MGILLTCHLLRFRHAIELNHLFCYQSMSLGQLHQLQVGVMRTQLFGCDADTTFSTLTGDNSPLMIFDQGRASFTRCSFRDLNLSEGIFDVSSGSSVRLANCTFTNITVPQNDYVSTFFDDGVYTGHASIGFESYADDDAGTLFDVQRHRANDSSIPEEGVSLFTVVRQWSRRGAFFF